MQHPVAYSIGQNGMLQLTSFWGLLTNPWILWQYSHNMIGSVVTAAFVMASVGAFYLLSGRHSDFGRTFVRVGIVGGLAGSILLLFPTGDGQGKMIARHQPVTLAAMEGLFETTEGAPVAIVGQPDPNKRRLDNPLLIPRMLSFITYQRWQAEVKGLDAFPRELWPDNIPLLFYAFHIMVGLGTIFIAVAAVAAAALWRGVLFTSKPLLWVLMLMAPFPYIANTAGWITAEVGRQPWLAYGLIRTEHGPSQHVSSGNVMFTLIGFMGMYALLAVLFLFLVSREIDHGPEEAA
jgi:cytochrome d ubiquinol oxidase subunit I